MSSHPDQAALEAYVLGHHDEIDQPTIERHIESCERCLDEVGREARLELLFHAAGAEDAFVAVAPLCPRRRWPVVATVAVAVAAAAAAALALLRSRSESDRPAAARDDVSQTGAAPAEPQPEWSRGLRFGKVQCVAADGGLTCAAASEVRRVRDDAAAEAGDLARVAMLDAVFSRGGPTITAQRALFVRGKAAALTSSQTDRFEGLRRFARLRHQVAEHALIGRRDAWYWEEYEALDGKGSEFMVFVRFRADEKEIDEFLARYQGSTVDGAVLVPAVPDIQWVLDPGDDLAFYVHLAGNLAELGVRSRDVILMDQRLNANAMRALVESDRVQVWRQGLERPVPPSKLR
jgi:hypothetical protein